MRCVLRIAYCVLRVACCVLLVMKRNYDQNRPGLECRHFALLCVESVFALGAPQQHHRLS